MCKTLSVSDPLCALGSREEAARTAVSLSLRTASLLLLVLILDSLLFSEVKGGKAVEKLLAGADKGVDGASFLTEGSFAGSDIFLERDASPVEEEDKDEE